MPDCAFQAHIPRDQRQYLGNWFKESTADVYTREKRHVVCSIWDQVLQKLPSMQLEAGRAVRVDLGHEDWDEKVECPASPKALFKEVPDTPPGVCWRSLRRRWALAHPMKPSGSATPKSGNTCCPCALQASTASAQYASTCSGSCTQPGFPGRTNKCKAAQALKKHLRDQYTDRLMYWSLRFASKVHNDVLVIIIDDMDHSKFAWPRWSFRKVTHELDRIIRPTLTFTGALAHGWGTYLYMAGPQVLGGSDYFLEVLSQTIECVFQQACRPAGHQSRGLPSHLVVVADNTVKSAKNQHVVLFLAYLVSRGLFKSATLFHLMVGHTHEDIDQLFALILALLKRKGHWETPQEILQHIAQSTLACD